MWATYVATQTLVVTQTMPELAGAFIGLTLGGAAVLMLVRGGVAATQCFLRAGRLSGRGALALLPVAVVWPFILASGR